VNVIILLTSIKLAFFVLKILSEALIRGPEIFTKSRQLWGSLPGLGLASG
jgi:hypothetical protein